MKNRHAFTLIEVLVVLSILALVAILSYNFFGGTMRDAAAVQGATKAYNDMRVISDALDLFELKTGAPLAGSSLAPLVDGGYLKSLPTMTSSMALNPAVAGYIYDSAMSDLDVDGDDDSYIATENVTMDICKAFNEKYASAPPSMSPPPMIQKGMAINRRQCFMGLMASSFMVTNQTIQSTDVS